MIFVAPRDERRPEHAEAGAADQVGRAGADHFVVDDGLFDGVECLAAVLPGPGEGDVAGVIEFALPGLRPGQPALVLALFACVGEAGLRDVLLEELADFGAELLFVGSEIQIHWSRPSTPNNMKRDSPSISRPGWPGW